MQYKVIGNVSFRGKKNVFKLGDVFDKDLVQDEALISHLLKKELIKELSLSDRISKKDKKKEEKGDELKAGEVIK